jgi:hypothetical protein
MLLVGEKLHILVGRRRADTRTPREQATRAGELDGAPRTVQRVHARAGEEASRAIGEDGPAASI